MLTVAVVVAVIALLATYLTWTAVRIDRLNVRVERADASLDAQLVRRAAAAEALAAYALRSPGRAAGPAQLVRDFAVSARRGSADKWGTENALTRHVTELALSVDPRADHEVAGLLDDLATASERVDLARAFYNQAVRDARDLRARAAPRVLRLAGRSVVPDFVEMDDTALAAFLEQPTSDRVLP